MVGSPQRHRRPPFGDSHDLANLKPTEQHMEIWSIRNIAPPFKRLVHFAEPTEEEEDVARAHTVPLEMCLGGAVLAEQRLPPRLPRNRTGPKIWIEMSGARRHQTIIGEIRHNPADRATVESDVLIPNIAGGMGNRQ